jgi:hypothetical protein
MTDDSAGGARESSGARNGLGVVWAKTDEPHPSRTVIDSRGEKDWVMDLMQHLLRQMAWSHATFGPGTRTEAVIDHLRKELQEVIDSNGEPHEWVDVVVLALDGLTRQIAYCNGERADPKSVAYAVCCMIEGVQGRNEARTWPDWRTAAQDKAIEHVR